MGSNGSLIESVRSILIEYGYIYRFGNSKMRHQAYVNMANLTVKGITNYFLGSRNKEISKFIKQSIWQSFASELLVAQENNSRVTSFIF